MTFENDHFYSAPQLVFAVGVVLSGVEEKTPGEDNHLQSLDFDTLQVHEDSSNTCYLLKRTRYSLLSPCAVPFLGCFFLQTGGIRTGMCVVNGL